ncbi:MAG: hypothetical protein QNJ54_36295 [Prochloraceae cyanobacterium]|nr:hypothetical protein [Prochloraceae cyanobacterium]
MLKRLPTSLTLPSIIKILSCALIAIALGLTVGQLYAIVTHHPLPHILEILFRIGSFVLFAHVLEGIVAFTIASRRRENPISAGIYTFWTGAVGLSETLQLSKDVDEKQ